MGSKSNKRGPYVPITDEAVITALLNVHRETNTWPGVVRLAEEVKCAPVQVHAVLGNMVARGVLIRVGWLRGWRPADR